MSTAHADMPVDRGRLRDPAFRREIRMSLFRMLQKLGQVRTVRYVRDPLDGPLVEQGLPSNDYAVIRAIGDVTPNAHRREEERQLP
jgi:hypothetical protein